MENAQVLEYKCPCCNAGLRFQEGTRQFTCEYCDNTFDLETIQAYNASQEEADSSTLTWDTPKSKDWNEEEQAQAQAFQCPACGAEIITEKTTAATFCPYCDNPTILSSRLNGTARPDAVLPFQNTKDDAKEAFLNLCKKKILLPKNFVDQQRLERITGVYVPFWLYDCDADFLGSYKATRLHTWSDSKYNYTRTDHFLLRRGGQAAFSSIPMDGSRKMDDTFMESIEPFDFTKLQDFQMGYLSGFLADQYDVPSEDGEIRIHQRVEESLNQELQSTFLGYATVLPVSKQTHVEHSKAKYVLLPVWMLHTSYNGKSYTFAMNGQSGKMTGTFPISAKRSWGWFAGVWAGITVLATLLQMVIL